MSNETKRDIFVNAVDALADAQASSDNNVGLGHQDADLFMAEYAAALPDDLPVIPKAVSEYIKWGKSYDIQLYMMYSFKFIHSQGFKKLTDDVESWIISSSKAFARAWLLGIWRVEETAEIVKLEEEK
jgi:hypothetical protein